MKRAAAATVLGVLLAAYLVVVAPFQAAPALADTQWLLVGDGAPPGVATVPVSNTAVIGGNGANQLATSEGLVLGTGLAAGSTYTLAGTAAADVAAGTSSVSICGVGAADTAGLACVFAVGVMLGYTGSKVPGMTIHAAQKLRDWWRGTPATPPSGLNNITFSNVTLNSVTVTAVQNNTNQTNQNAAFILQCLVHSTTYAADLVQYVYLNGQWTPGVGGNTSTFSPAGAGCTAAPTSIVGFTSSGVTSHSYETGKWAGPGADPLYEQRAWNMARTGADLTETYYYRGPWIALKWSCYNLSTTATTVTTGGGSNMADWVLLGSPTISGQDASTALPSPFCAAGSIVTDWQVIQYTGVNFVPWQDSNIANSITTVYEWKITTVPVCVTNGTTCRTQLLHNGLPCSAGDPVCRTWNEPADQTVYTDSAGVTCSVGGTLYPLSNCSAMVGYYTPGSQYDPGTGIKVLTVNPVQPSASPTVTTSPAPSGSPSAGGPTPLPDPPVDASTGCTVDSSLTGFLTGSFFITGLKCVFQWAFVPPADDLTALWTSTTTAVDAVPDVALITGVVDVFQPLVNMDGSGVDCHGPEIAIPRLGPVAPISFYPFAACTPPGSTWAPWIRNLMGVVVLFAAAIAAAKNIGSAFGWHLALKGGDS